MVKNTALERAQDNSLFFQKASFFKFWLLLSVFLVHAVNYEAYGLAQAEGVAAALLYWIEDAIVYFCGVSLAMYFFISGYSFMLGYSPQQAGAKLKRRFYSLFIPWLLWNTIMWLFGIAVESVPQVAQHLNSGFGFQLSLRSWLVDGLWYNADGPMWFVANLMICALAGPLIYYLVKNKYAGLILLAVGAGLLWLDNTGRYSVFMSLIFYAEGCYFALHLHSFMLRRHSRALRALAWGILIVYLLFLSEDSVLNGGILHVLVYSVTNIALWVAVGNALLGPVAKKCEKYRFWLYAAHYLPLECVEKLWLIIGGVSVGTAWAGMLICPTLTIIVLVAAAMLVEKFCYPLWCVLAGKKPALRAPD